MANQSQTQTETEAVLIATTTTSSEQIDSILNMRWRNTTKYGYERCMIDFLAWVESSPEFRHMLTPERQLSPSFSLAPFLLFCAQKKKVDKNTGESVNLSYSGINKYRSALKYLYTKSERVMTPEEEEQLTNFFKGIKRRCAQEKQDGFRPMQEGKAEMPVDLYRALAKHFYASGDVQSAAYLILTWNLCCRTNNTEAIKMKHLHWHQDALKIQFGLTKSNQEAEREEWRLLFSNPQDPSMCPIFAIAVYLAVSNREYAEQDRLFLGGTPADTFHKALKQALRSPVIETCLRFHGLNASDIGAHSIRKGAATFLANGSTCGPSYSSICIRMSWSMGVQGRYLHYNYAMDAFCGRILALLDQNSYKFALLPPHTLVPIDFELTKNVFPSTRALSSLEQVRQFMTTTLLHHASTIGDLLPRHHMLFQTFLFRNLTSIGERIDLISGLSSPVLSANGLPPHVLSWLNHLRIQDLLTEMPQKILEGIGTTLQENGIAAGNVTKELLESMMRNLVETVTATHRPSVAPTTTTLPEFYPFLWSDDHFHRLPEDFEFPDLNVLQGWLLWFEGNREKGLPPFRLLSTIDVPKVCRKRYGELKCMIRILLDQIPENERRSLNNMQTDDLIAKCQAAASCVPKKTKKKNTRVSEWKIGTALREAREARILINPELKRTHRSPARPSLPRSKRLRR